ncbi:hypothetical protein ACP70R_048574 [Stipagrostis hirtigluma subsp. patula]
MASMPPSLGVVKRPSSPDGKPHSVSERSLPSEKNIAQGGRFAFKSKNSKYLCYLPSRCLPPSEENKAQGGGETQKPCINLAMNGDDAKNPYARFSLEPSRKPGNEGLVHIRCCYNNKYWVPVAVPHSDDTGNKRKQTVILCTANKPEDDKSKSTCTLFRPSGWSPTENSIRFLYKEKPVCLENVDQVDCLIVRHGSNIEDAHEFTAIDLETHEMVLPEEVCFRGDNGLYLRAVDDTGLLQFSSNDIGDPTAKHTIVTDENGTIRIKNNYLEKFFSLKKETELKYGIYADAVPGGKNTTKFHLVKLDNNATIALYVKDDDGSNRYCRRFTIDGQKQDLFSASTKGIIKEAMLQMQEAVLSRRIYNVEYHTLDARVYGQKTLTMSAAQAINRSSKENKAKLTLKYSSSKQATWESSVSAMAGVAVTMKVEVPEIVEVLGADIGFEIQSHYEVSASYNWGETNLDTTEQSVEYEITVPPKTKVRLCLVATQGVCEIPFSYMQEDILTNGGKVTSRLEDGLFRGVNSYDFQYEVKESPITNG